MAKKKKPAPKPVAKKAKKAGGEKRPPKSTPTSGATSKKSPAASKKGGAAPNAAGSSASAATKPKKPVIPTKPFLLAPDHAAVRRALGRHTGVKGREWSDHEVNWELFNLHTRVKKHHETEGDLELYAMIGPRIMGLVRDHFDGRDVQKVLEEMVWEHGSKLEQNPLLPTLLKHHRLTAKDFTVPMLRQAERACDERLKAELLHPSAPPKQVETEIVWRLEPTALDWDLYKVSAWLSRCGRYRITHLTPKFNEADESPRWGASFKKTCPQANKAPDRVMWDVVANDRGVMREFRTVRAAIDAIEAHAKAKSANAMAFVEAAEALHPPPRAAPTQVVTPDGSVVQVRVPRKVYSGELDAFGSPVGSNEALVNAALKETPLSFKEICEATGLSRGQVRYLHLAKLVEQGFAVKSELGWALAPKKKEKANAGGKVEKSGAARKGKGAKAEVAPRQSGRKRR